MYSCNIRIGKDNSCNNHALYFYELTSTVALRCAEHKDDLQSPKIYSKGDMPIFENEAEQLMKRLQNNCDERLHLDGIKDVPAYHKIIDDITEQLTTCTPSKYKKLKKKFIKACGNEGGLEELEELYKKYNIYQKNVIDGSNEYMKLPIEIQEAIKSCDTCLDNLNNKTKNEFIYHLGKEHPELFKVYDKWAKAINTIQLPSEIEKLSIPEQDEWKGKEIARRLDGMDETDMIRMCISNGHSTFAIAHALNRLFDKPIDLLIIHTSTTIHRLSKTCEGCQKLIEVNDQHTPNRKLLDVGGHLKEFHPNEYVELSLFSSNVTDETKLYLIKHKNESHMSVEQRKETMQLFLIERQIEILAAIETGTVKYNPLTDKHKKSKYIKKVKPQKISYEEFCELAKNLKIHSRTDWINYSKTEACDEHIPIHPETFYKKEWEGFPKVFGYEQKVRRKPLTRDVVLEMIRKIRTRWLDYQNFPDAFLTNWFETTGLFGIKDPYLKQMFRNFIAWRNDPEGKKALEHWLTYEDFDIPYGGYSLDISKKPEKEAKEYMDRQTTKLTEVRQVGLLEQQEPIGIAKIMLNAKEIVPSKDDSKWYWQQVIYRTKQIWEQLFDEDNFDAEIKEMRKQITDNEFHADILELFWLEYNMVKTLDYGKEEYTSDLKPKLIQLYGAYEMTQKNGFFNMSSTGAYKTGMAIMSAVATKSSYVLAIVPKNIVDQWKLCVRDFYKNLYVSTGKEISDNFWVYRNQLKAKHRPNFHIINYDRFSRKKSVDRVIKSIEKHEGRIDFIIIDEAHLIKNSSDDARFHSARRVNIERLVSSARSKNRKLKVLMLSATPIVNNIREGKSLLELVTGTKYDFSTYGSIRNATKLYTEFIPYSMNYQKNYHIDIRGQDDPITVDAYIPEHYTEENFKNLLNWNMLEQIATKYRLPEIIRLVKEMKGQTIIYTDYTTGVVDMIYNELVKNDIRVGLFTGLDKGGHHRNTGRIDEHGDIIYDSPFVKGEIDVLIASRPFAVGIDGLQFVCNNLIFNGLVWTWSQFEQIIGRIVRSGQISNFVNIKLIFANINGYEYDEKVKYNRLKAKKALGDCIRNGTLPEKIKFGNTETERLSMIEQMFKNRATGFPEKEKIESELQLEAAQELEVNMEELHKLEHKEN